MTLAVVGCAQLTKPVSVPNLGVPQSANLSLPAYSAVSIIADNNSGNAIRRADVGSLSAVPNTAAALDVFQATWWHEPGLNFAQKVAWFGDSQIDDSQITAADFTIPHHNAFGDFADYQSADRIHQPQFRRLPSIESIEPPVTYSSLLSEQMSGIAADHSEFYSGESLTWLAFGFAIGAGMANTGFDEHFIRDTYIDNVVLATTDDFFEALHEPKFFGEGQYTIPAFALLALSEPLIEDLPMGSEAAEWGQRSFRSVLLGAPPLIGLQLLTGASRPGETTQKSHWKPFQDSNGVSGHSFMGAIPFMSAAQMTENKWLKAGLYTLSTLPAFSRVNDDDHYFSQAFLGWWLAYIATTAVDQSHQQNEHYHFLVYPQQGGMAVGLEIIR